MGSAESRPGSEAQLAAVARRFGTPLYVMDASALAQAAEQVERAFPAPWVLHYSLKANDLPAVTALLAERGWGANVVSVGEWELARAAGVAAGRTTVEGIGKTDADLAAVVASAAEGRGVRWVSVESRGELARLTELVSHRATDPATGKPAPLPAPIDVLLRLNPEVQPETSSDLAVGLPSSKFGMAADEARAAASDVTDPNVRVRGVHVHVGSDLGDVVAWAVAGRRAVELLEELRTSHPHADTVDFGGGFPGLGHAPTPQDFHAALVARARRRGAAHAARLRDRARSLGGRLGRDAGGRRAAREVASAVPTTDRPRRRDDRADPPRALREPSPRHRRRARHRRCQRATSRAHVHRRRGPDLRVDRLVRGAPASGAVARRSRGAREAGAYCASFTSRYNGRPHPREVVLAEDGSCTLGVRTDLSAPQIPPHPPQAPPVTTHRAQPERSSA